LNTHGESSSHEKRVIFLIAITNMDLENPPKSIWVNFLKHSNSKDFEEKVNYGHTNRKQKKGGFFLIKIITHMDSIF
jgi:hypothetical protein